MKAKLFFVGIIVIFSSSIYSQLIDSFSDGDFTNNPAWSGTLDNWQVVTNSTAGVNTSGSFTLRLNGPSNDSVQYLSVNRTETWGDEQTWGFWLGRRSQAAATTTNKVFIWLYSNESNLTSEFVNGYRLSFGDNSGDDEIILQKVSNGVANDILISNSPVVNGISDYSFLIRVTRSAESLWNLYTSTLPTVNGEGATPDMIPSIVNTSVFQGSVSDDTYTNFENGYLGVVAVHTSGDQQRTGLEFDQIYFDTDAEAPLPVELSSFTASTMSNSVKLNWITQTEIQNYGFDIERAAADKNNWQKIGFVKGNGNSNSPKNYSYTDENLKSGKYFYRLKQLDTDGKFEYSAKVEAVVSAPLKFSLEQNFPNPFNPTTNIDYSIPTDGRVKLTIFNLLGQQAAVLIDEYKTAGEYTAVFDAKGLSSGLYFYKLESNGLTTVKKMTLLR